jgi:hypothetical protein
VFNGSGVPERRLLVVTAFISSRLAAVTLVFGQCIRQEYGSTFPPLDYLLSETCSAKMIPSSRFLVAKAQTRQPESVIAVRG